MPRPRLRLWGPKQNFETSFSCWPRGGDVKRGIRWISMTPVKRQAAVAQGLAEAQAPAN